MKQIALRLSVAILTFVVGVGLSSVSLSSESYQEPIQLRGQSGASVTEWHLLLSYENQDLKKLDTDSEELLKAAINSVLKRPRDFARPYFVPSMFSKFSNAHGLVRYVLVEELPQIVIPSDSHLRIHVFDREGALLNSETHSAGWANKLTGTKSIKLTKIDKSVLEVTCLNVFRGTKTKQYYGFIDDSFMLIRLEGEGGHLAQNCYSVQTYSIGPTAVERSSTYWQDTLDSDDVVEVLASLTWLGGEHEGLAEARE